MRIECKPRRSRRRQLSKLCQAHRQGMESLEPRRMFSTYTVNASGGGANYTDLETAIVNVPAGSTLLVSAGTYTAHTTVIDPSASVFWINKSLTIKSVSGPGSTILTAPAGQVQDLLISSSNVRIEGFSLHGGEFCADVQDFLNNTNLTNVVLKNLNLTPDSTSGDGHGILYESVSNSVIDGCTVGTSYANGIFLDAQSNNDIVMNNVINGTVTQHGIAVKNSNNDQVANNTITSSAFDGVILFNASNCRVTANSIAGHKVDGITLTNSSDFNYVGLNTIVSNGYAAGRSDGSGIWMNDESDGNTIFGNTTSGSPECGIADFVSSNNLISSNEVFGNKEGGIFVWDAQGDATYSGNAPVNITITNNFLHDNTFNGGVILRGVTNTDIERNFIKGVFTGTYGSSTDGAILVERSTGTQFIGNTMQSLQTGVYAYATAGTLSVYRNRFINVGNNYAFPGASATFDDSVTIGGNYWSDQAAAGDPSTTTPYTKFIYDNIGHMGGGVKDAYPFQSESLGQPYSGVITSPAAGTYVAAFSKRAIQWTSTGSALVSIYYYSSETGQVAIALHRPDYGEYSWTAPTVAAGNDYVIRIVPENSAGTAQGATIVSGTFSCAGTDNLILMTPGRDANAAPGSTMRVAWQTVTPGTGVDVQIQTNGGAWSTLASNVTDDFTDVTLPGTTTNQARIRIINHSTLVGDAQDFYFRIGTTAAISSISNLKIGTLQTLSWISPAGADTVDVQYSNGVTWLPIATRLPDTGHVDWFVPEMFTNNANVRVLFHNSGDTQFANVSSNPFNIAYTLAGGSQIASYRLYNNVTKEHLYTTDLNEYNVLGANGWSQEGSPFKVYNGPATVGGVNDIPTYRLYNPSTYQHLWTTDRNEYFVLRVSGSWNPEGVANYEFASAVTGSMAFYRMSYNGPTLLHLWTTDLNEYNTLPGSGWTKESIIGYVMS